MLVRSTLELNHPTGEQGKGSVSTILHALGFFNFV